MNAPSEVVDFFFVAWTVWIFFIGGLFGRWYERRCTATPTEEK